MTRPELALVPNNYMQHTTSLVLSDPIMDGAQSHGVSRFNPHQLLFLEQWQLPLLNPPASTTSQPAPEGADSTLKSRGSILTFSFLPTPLFYLGLTDSNLW